MADNRSAGRKPVKSPPRGGEPKAKADGGRMSRRPRRPLSHDAILVVHGFEAMGKTRRRQLLTWLRTQYRWLLRVKPATLAPRYTARLMK